MTSDFPTESKMALAIRSHLDQRVFQRRWPRPPHGPNTDVWHDPDELQLLVRTGFDRLKRTPAAIENDQLRKVEMLRNLLNDRLHDLRFDGEDDDIRLLTTSTLWRFLHHRRSHESSSARSDDVGAVDLLGRQTWPWRSPCMRASPMFRYQENRRF